MIDHTAIQDKITQVIEFWQVKKDVDKLKTPEREKILGLKFVQGDKVKDSVTGEGLRSLEELEKLLAFRVPEVKDVKIYAVRTKDGKILARTEEELGELPKEIKTE